MDGTIFLFGHELIILYQLHLVSSLGHLSKEGDASSGKASTHSESLGSLLGPLWYVTKAEECLEELMSFQCLGLCSMIAKKKKKKPKLPNKQTNKKQQ